MTSTGLTVLVLREGEEGLPMADYAAELVDRLPDHDVRLAETPAQERELAPSAEVITGGSLPADVLEAATDLRLFAATTSGYGSLPTAELEARGVAVTNAAGIHAPGIAEQVIGNLLVFARNLHEGWRRARNGQWRYYQAGELKGSTVTIVGLGAIGTAVVERLAPFDVETIGIRYTPSKGGPTDEVCGFDDEDLHDALARSDYVVCCCPLSETTAGLVDERALVTLPPHAVLVNVARGGVVDTPALLEALQTGGIRGAALDVTDPEPLPGDHPLWRLDNALITPHVGGSTPRHWDRLASIVAENVVRIAGTGERSDLKNRVV